MTGRATGATQVQAVSEDLHLVGPVYQPASAMRNRRNDSTTGTHAGNQQRNLDEALQELLTEWEQD